MILPLKKTPQGWEAKNDDIAVYISTYSQSNGMHTISVWSRFGQISFTYMGNLYDLSIEFHDRVLSLLKEGKQLAVQFCHDAGKSSFKYTLEPKVSKLEKALR